MYLVYIETLKVTIGDERLEKLANAIIFRDDGGIFRRENYCFCDKEMLFRILLMANKHRYVHFISLPTLDPNSPALMPVKLR